MMQERSIVAVPFRVAAGFLLLLFLWGFTNEEVAMSNPNKYEYEHFKKSETENRTEGEASHGSYMPWKPSVEGRTMHLDTDALAVGNRVQLHGLSTRPDLNGVTGRVMAFDGHHYTVRLKHGIGRFKLKKGNLHLYASVSTAKGLALEAAADSSSHHQPVNGTHDGSSNSTKQQHHEISEAAPNRVVAGLRPHLAGNKGAGAGSGGGNGGGAGGGGRGGRAAPLLDPFAVGIALLLFGCFAMSRLAPLPPPQQRLSIKAAAPPRRLLLAQKKNSEKTANEQEQQEEQEQGNAARHRGSVLTSNPRDQGAGGDSRVAAGDVEEGGEGPERGEAHHQRVPRREQSGTRAETETGGARQLASSTQGGGEGEGGESPAGSSASGDGPAPTPQAPIS